MAFNFADYKVEIFSGINDDVIPPTANKAGNGSHLISKVNEFIDETEANLNYLRTNSAYYWKIIDADYNSQIYDYILLKPTQDNTFYINLPFQESLNLGDWICLCSFTNNNNIQILLNGAQRFNGIIEPEVVFKGARQPVYIIWTGNDLVGWMTTNTGSFQVTSNLVS